MKLSNLTSRQLIFPTATVPYYTEINFYALLNNRIVARETKPGSVLLASCMQSVSAEGCNNKNTLGKGRESTFICIYC